TLLPTSGSTCPPSPCVRLSRTRTTTRTPSPWGSRPVGDPEFSAHRTYQHGLGRPLIPTPGIISRYLTARACRGPQANPRLAVTRRGVSVAAGPRLPRSGLDLKPSSLGHTTRVLRSVWLADIAGLRFSGRLWSPVSFDRWRAG